MKRLFPLVLLGLTALGLASCKSLGASDKVAVPTRLPSHIVAEANRAGVKLPKGPLNSQDAERLIAKLYRSDIRARRALRQAVRIRTAGKRRSRR